MDIGPEINLCWWDSMLTTVPGDEGYLYSFNFSDAKGRGSFSVGSMHIDISRFLQFFDVVQSRSADDAYFGHFDILEKVFFLRFVVVKERGFVDKFILLQFSITSRRIA